MLLRRVPSARFQSKPAVCDSLLTNLFSHSSGSTKTLKRSRGVLALDGLRREGRRDRLLHVPSSSGQAAGRRCSPLQGPARGFQQICAN